MAEDAKTPQPVRLEDYRPPDCLVEQVDLEFRLGPTDTEVTARLAVRRNPAAGEGGRPLVLDGQELELLQLRLDGEPLGSNRYQVDADHLIVHDLPQACTLESTVRINPAANTALEGLYVSNGVFCTQCEPEGFRKITYFLDRPDVMARYRVRIEAEKAAYPVLLANGNRIDSGALPDGRHFALGGSLPQAQLPVRPDRRSSRQARGRFRHPLGPQGHLADLYRAARSTNATTPWPRSRSR
jgi:aminopeptidase N